MTNTTSKQKEEVSSLHRELREVKKSESYFRKFLCTYSNTWDVPSKSVWVSTGEH